jgi:hypothetical protein
VHGCRYLVEFQPGCGLTGYAVQWWRNATSRRTATVITVTAGATVPGIGASLTR